MELGSGISNVDLQLALKLRDKYPEHFQNLVRMHLSFALDLNIEEYVFEFSFDFVTLLFAFSVLM